jgi:hypothetical protein
MATGKDLIKATMAADGTKIQMLQSCLEKVDKKRDRVVVSFGTTAATVNDVLDGTNMVGVVLWVPRDVYDRVQNGDLA